MNKLILTFCLIAMALITLVRHERPASALRNNGGAPGADVCNHFSVDYDAMACFFQQGNPNGGSGGGGNQTQGCPGGTQPSCVVCEHPGVCVQACYGDLTCKFDDDGNGNKICSSNATRCRTL